VALTVPASGPPGASPIRPSVAERGLGLIQWFAQLKDTGKVHEPFTGIIPRLQPAAPVSALKAKSFGSALEEALLTEVLAGTVPVLVTVKLWTALLVSTATVPKSRLDGLTCSGDATWAITGVTSVIGETAAMTVASPISNRRNSEPSYSSAGSSLTEGRYLPSVQGVDGIWRSLRLRRGDVAVVPS
jgi:hypothetical protein